MRHRRAVEKLRILAETCERVKLFWFDTEPFLKAVYAFGEVLDGADPLDDVQVAVAINLPPEEVPWESTPEGADWLADELRLSKGGFLYFWRSYLDPVWNHYIRGPVRVWSVDGGPDEQALAALEARDFGSLNRLVPTRSMSGFSSGTTWTRRWLICARSATGTGIMTGGASTVATAATRRTNCGKRSRDSSTWSMPPGPTSQTPEIPHKTSPRRHIAPDQSSSQSFVYRHCAVSPVIGRPETHQRVPRRDGEPGRHTIP
jgi:hypothetical protein